MNCGKYSDTGNMYRINRIKTASIVLFLVMHSTALFSFEIVETDFQQYLGQSTDTIFGMLQSASESAPPKQLNNLVIFMNKPSRPVRYMGIAFAHEEFSKIHLFSKQDAGVYYYLYQVKGEVETLEYRLVVDGIWRADDTHDNSFNDAYGHRISKVDLDTSVVSEDVRPQLLANGYVRFKYRGTPSARVFLNSDIGSWDPFLFRMIEIRDGFYEVTVRMTKGVHYYYFIENGNKVLGNVSLDTRIHKIEGDVNQLLVH